MSDDQAYPHRMPTVKKTKDLKRSHIDTRVSREEFRRIRELFPNGRQSKGTDLSEVIRTLLMMYVNNIEVAIYSGFQIKNMTIRELVRERMEQNWQQP